MPSFKLSLWTPALRGSTGTPRMDSQAGPTPARDGGEQQQEQTESQAPEGTRVGSTGNSSKLRLRWILQNYCPAYFKTIQDQECRERWRNCSKWRITGPDHWVQFTFQGFLLLSLRNKLLTIKGYPEGKGSLSPTGCWPNSTGALGQVPLAVSSIAS